MSKIHIESFGVGQPIVMVHGWGMHSGIWREFALDLAQSYQITLVDLPGHGLSPAITPFTLQTIAESLVNAVDSAPACWLGWSFGVEVVLAIVQRFPERVNKLILLAGSPCFVKKQNWPGMAESVLDNFAASLLQDSQATLLRFLALQINGLENSKNLLQQLKSAVSARPMPDPAILQAGLQILKETDLREVFSACSVPIQVVLGGKDTLVPITLAEKLGELRPNLPVTIIDRAGHTPFLSHKAGLLTAINVFLENPSC